MSEPMSADLPVSQRLTPTEQEDWADRPVVVTYDDVTGDYTVSVLDLQPRLPGNLKRAVADLIEGYAASAPPSETFPGGFSKPEQIDENITCRSAMTGFDVRDDQGELIGRFVGYVHLFNDATPEQFAERAREAAE